MKNYKVYYEMNGKKMVASACGRNAVEVQSIWNRVYPTAKVIGIEVVKDKNRGN